MNSSTATLVGAPNGPPPEKVNLPPSLILLVDDDVCIREGGARLLVNCGCRVDTAENGVAGWQALEAKSYDLLITDQNMPQLTGVDLIKKLRQAEIALPVILMSGVLPTEELARHPWLQLAATLEKPFAPRELLALVKQVLEPTIFAGGPIRCQSAQATPQPGLVGLDAFTHRPRIHLAINYPDATTGWACQIARGRDIRGSETKPGSEVSSDRRA